MGGFAVRAGVVLVVAGLFTAPNADARGQTVAQSPSAGCSASEQSAGHCSPAQSTGQRFPYPGETPDASSGGAKAPGSDGSSSARSAPESGQAAPSAAKRFPYPGEPDASGSSSSSSGSSSSSSSSSSSQDSDPDDASSPEAPTDGATPGRRKLPKVKKLQSDEDREAEDVKVAKFYSDAGNALASYNRLRDATKLISDDADAWYLLGVVATKLHKTDEANEAYRNFLALEPGTRRAKTLVREQPALQAAR